MRVHRPFLEGSRLLLRSHRMRTISVVSVAVAMFVALVAYAIAVSAQRVATPSAPALAAKALALPASGWPTNGGDLFNRRYSPLVQINRQNVAGLKGVWHVQLNRSGAEAKYSGEAQPLIDDGIIYIVTGADDVF